MQTTENTLNSNTAKAAALSHRLETINEHVKASSASPALKDATLKAGLAYAIFLTELEEGGTAHSEEQIQLLLERTEQHCHLYETEFSKLVKGSSEDE